MDRKYIIFRADWTQEQGAENRLLAHTGAFTDILAEYFDSSNDPIPEPGYRLLEFHCTDGSGSSTHYRTGDWKVVKVETYSADIPGSEFKTLAVCYCHYSPVETPLIPMPEAKVSVDSFGNEEQYQQYLEQTKQTPAEVI